MFRSLTKAQTIQSLPSQWMHGFYLGVKRVARGEAVLRVLRSSPHQYPSKNGPSKSEYYLERKDKRAKPETFKQAVMFLKSATTGWERTFVLSVVPSSKCQITNETIFCVWTQVPWDWVIVLLLWASSLFGRIIFWTANLKILAMLSPPASQKIRNHLQIQFKSLLPLRRLPHHLNLTPRGKKILEPLQPSEKVTGVW